MTTAHPYDSVLDDLFHGCAAAAFVDEAICQQGWPGIEATRRRAFRYYEEALAARQDERQTDAARTEQSHEVPNVPAEGKAVAR